MFVPLLPGGEIKCDPEIGKTAQQPEPALTADLSISGSRLISSLCTEMVTDYVLEITLWYNAMQGLIEGGREGGKGARVMRVSGLVCSRAIEGRGAEGRKKQEGGRGGGRGQCCCNMHFLLTQHFSRWSADRKWRGYGGMYKLSRCVARRLHAERHQGATYPKPR